MCAAAYGMVSSSSPRDMTHVLEVYGYDSSMQTRSITQALEKYAALQVIEKARFSKFYSISTHAKTLTQVST